MKLKECYDRLLPRYARWPLLGIFFYNSVVFWCTRPMVAGHYHYDMSLPFEKNIPLLTWTIVIYLLAFVFWAVNYIMASWESRQAFKKVIYAELAAKTVCLVCFLFVPTAMVRLEITGTSFFDWLTGLIYRLDTPDNLFPSIHCLESWFCYIAVRKNAKIPVWYRWFSLVFAIVVCISTLTVKQHVFLDAVSGVALAEISYQAVCLIMKKRNRLEG